MLESDGALKLPSAALGDFEVAGGAYRTWLGSQGNFLWEDEAAAAARDFRTSLEVVIAVSLAAGVNRQQLLTAMVETFPDARQLVTEMIPPAEVQSSVTLDPVQTVVRTFPVSAAAWTRSCPVCASEVLLDAEYCSKCGTELGEPGFSDILPLLQALQTEIHVLHSKARLPKTNLLANDFITRAFTVYGHALVANLIILIPIILLLFLAITLAVGIG